MENESINPQGLENFVWLSVTGKLTPELVGALTTGLVGAIAKFFGFTIKAEA